MVVNKKTKKVTNPDKSISKLNAPHLLFKQSKNRSAFSVEPRQPYSNRCLEPRSPHLQVTAGADHPTLPKPGFKITGCRIA
jgi:hypothetical protein